jgi:uncharacterized phage protein gp47/JayE
MTTIPTLSQLYNSIINDLQTELGVQISPVGRVFLRAFAAVQAAKLKLFYLAVGFLQKNIFVDTADPESLGGTLERFGRVKLNRNPFSAIAAVYKLTVTGTVGATIPANTTFRSDDNSLNPQKLFILPSAYTLVTATDYISVTALQAGLGSALDLGDTLTATAPIANVNQVATRYTQITAPIAAENIETYRAKVLEAYRLEPQGGAATDYRLWSSDAQGVKQVYPYTATGAVNEVNVFVEATSADSVPVGSGIPTAAILADVVAVINQDPDTSLPTNDRGRRPVQVVVNVASINALPVTITVTNYSNLTATLQATIEASLTSYVNAIRPFVDAADVLSDQNSSISQNGIISTILQAVPSSFFDSVTLTVDGSTVASHDFTFGDIPRLTSITFA